MKTDHKGMKLPDHHADEIPPVVQVAALCHRKGKSGREVLLVTSSRGRWILPKGWPMDGKHDRKAAQIEAWEEAGVRKGKVTRKPIAKFKSRKRFDNGFQIPAMIKVYGIKVAATDRKYPEHKKRDRRWVSVKKAGKLLKEKGYLKALATL